MKTDPTRHAQLFTELNEMNKLRQQAREKDPQALKQVAQQFEQLFMNMLLKTMRDANAGLAEDSYFNSPQTKFYEQMYDSQLTKELAEGKGIGLAEILVQQLGGKTDPRMQDEEDEGDKRLKPLSESERLLNRTVDTAAHMAASAILGQAQANSRAIEKAQQAAEVAASKTETVPVTVKAGAEGQALPQRFDTPEQFVRSLLPLAEKVAGELGVDPKVLLAQSALETGWGRHLVSTAGGGSSYNLFNIKADSRWDGERAMVGTLEFRNGVAEKEQAAFRVYDSYEQSFRDYADFLKGSGRYQQALEQAGDPYSYLSGLQEAGYATDPEYANKIGRIFDGELLASALPDQSANSGKPTKES